MQATAQPEYQLGHLFDWNNFAAFARILMSQTRRRQGTLSLLLITLVAPPKAIDEPKWREQASFELGDVLARTVRNGDILGSHGPGSYAIVAVDTNQVDAIRLAKRVWMNLQGRTVLGASLVDWVAIGIATQPESGMTLQELLRHAEVAAAQAEDGGGGRVRLFGWDGSSQHLIWEQQRDLLTARRQAGLARLTMAHERGEIQGGKVQTQPGACTVCRGAAREVHRYDALPALPIVGCTMSTGCRCTYTSPALQGSAAYVPVPVGEAKHLDIPGKLRDASLFGSDPRRRCKPNDLAEYLDHYPFLWIETDLGLQEGEYVLLQRRAEYSWERVTAASSTVHGALLPVEQTLTAWLPSASKPVSFPKSALLGGVTGMMYLTNRRILFQSEQGVDAVSLFHVADLECLREGFACRADEWQSRLIFLVDEPLLVSMFVARAIRAAVYDG